LENYTALTGREVVGNQVRATLPDGTTRYYDGLFANGDGSYVGVEVKSGSARLNASQRAFDGPVGRGGIATATLDGMPITINSTYLVNVQ